MIQQEIPATDGNCILGNNMLLCHDIYCIAEHSVREDLNRKFILTDIAFKIAYENFNDYFICLLEGLIRRQQSYLVLLFIKESKISRIVIFLIVCRQCCSTIFSIGNISNCLSSMLSIT